MFSGRFRRENTWTTSLFFEEQLIHVNAESPQASGRSEYTMTSVFFPNRRADQQPLTRVKGICVYRGFRSANSWKKVVVTGPAEYKSFIDSVELTYHLGHN